MPERTTWEAKHMAVGLDMNGTRNKKVGTIVDGAAMRYSKDTGIYTAPGYTQINSLGNSAVVDTLYGSKGGSLVGLNSLWAKGGTGVYHSAHTSTPYTIGVTRTATERDTFVEQGNGDIYIFNQVDTFTRVAVAKTLAAVTIVGGEISVGTAYIDKFAASGTVYINGVAVVYTTRTLGTGKLSGLTGVPVAGLPAGALVTQSSSPATAVDPGGTAITGICGMEVEGSLLVAGRKGAEDAVFYSAPADFQYPERFYDFQGNGANVKIMPVPIVAMINGAQRGYMFGEQSIFAVLGFDANATGALLTAPVPTTQGFGAYNARCVVDMGGGDVAVLGQNRFIPVRLSTDSGGQVSSSPDENFDYPIQPWLARFDADQSDSAMLSMDRSKRWLKITGKIDGTLQTRIFDTTKGLKAFTPTESKPARCYAFFNGKSYFGSNSGDKIFEDFASRTNNGIPMEHRWKTSELSFGDKGEGLLGQFFQAGFATKKCEMTMNIYSQGKTQPIYTKKFVLDDYFISTASGLSVGENGIGTSVPGGESSQGGTSVFPYEQLIELTGLTGKDFQLEFIVTKEGAFLQQNSFYLDCQVTRFSDQDAV